MGRSAKSKRQEKLERSFAEAGCDMSIAEERESSPVQGLSHRFRLPDTDTPHARPLPKPVLLPETFGNQPGQDFTTYMRHFVHTCELSGYDDEQKLRLLPARLVGTAHEMFTEILTHTPDINFSDAVEALHVRPPEEDIRPFSRLQKFLWSSVFSCVLSIRCCILIPRSLMMLMSNILF